MSVCPGCGRCRECGHAAPPIRTYPWYGPYPTLPQSQPIWWSNPITTMPQPPYTVISTSGTNWTAV